MRQLRLQVNEAQPPAGRPAERPRPAPVIDSAAPPAGDQAAAYAASLPAKRQSPVGDSAPPPAAGARARQGLAFSLYNGDLPRYRDGAYENLDLWPKKFPGWELWIYYDKTTSQPVLQRLRDGGATMIDMTDSGLSNAMTWRFTVASDPTVDRYLIRDIDSRLNQRDKDAVDEWIASDKMWHIVRDHPSHSRFPMSGGLWGATKDAIPDMTTRLKRIAISTEYVADMNWLTKVVWPIAKTSVMQHDSFSCDKYGGPAGGARSFPSPREYPEQHIGSVHLKYGAKERKVDSDMLIKAVRDKPPPGVCNTPPPPPPRLVRLVPWRERATSATGCSGC